MDKKVPLLRFKDFVDDWEQYSYIKKFKLSQGLQIAIAERYTTFAKNRFFYITNEFLKETCEEEWFVENPPTSVICKKEDVLMTRTGNTGIVITDVEGCFHNNFFKVDFDRELFDKYYLYYFWQSPEMHKIILSKAGSSTIPDLSHKSFLSLTSLFPIKKEQEKIALLCRHVSENINNNFRKISKLKNLKKALFEKMFPTKGNESILLRFKGYGSAWQKKTLGKIGTTYTGLSGKTKDDFGHGEARFVTYVNVFKNPIADVKGVDFVEIDASQNIVKNGDVLFTTSSETPEEVGMSSVWLGDTENTYLNSFCFGYRLFSSEKIDPLYLAYLLRSPEIRKEFQFLAQGISRYNISKTKVMDIVISVPEDYEEQVKIGKLFFNLDKLIELTQKKYEKLESLKKAMLNKMFV